ncbi:MAG: hypothetical protein LW704_02615 [Cryomorphaceae bacterium]|jgi:hypothetical protein|nr:hypothetical protein [Cryomorphaceae bacterium]
MKLNPKIIQVAADAAIPLMGFFLWEWSLYFILLFYLLDLLASEIIAHLSARKIHEYNGQKKRELKQAMISMMLFVVTLFVVHVFVAVAVPGIDFKKEALAFWSYEDMGIAQGYVLIPLVLFVAIQRYRMEFLMRGKFRTVQSSIFWQQHFKMYFMLIGGVGLALGIAHFVLVPELAYVLAAVVSTTAYTLYFKPD